MIGILESGDWVVYGVLVVAKVTVVLGCAYLASWLLRGRAAAVRHAVWATALAGVIALPLLAAAFLSLRVGVALPAWPAVTEAVSAPDVAAAAAAVEATPSLIAPALSAPVSADRAPLLGGGSRVDESGTHGRGSAALRAESRSMPVSRDALLLVWLAGALAVLSYTLLSVLHVRLLARRAWELRAMRVLARATGIASELGVKRPVELLEGEPDTMPMTFGVLTDTLLLPCTARSWSAKRLDGVLRHELAHIRRRDSLTQLIAEIACALYWFHPGAWFAARRLRVEREHACDDVVLLAGARASDYAQELLEITRTMRPHPALARAALAMARPSGLRARLIAVLEDRPRAARLPGTLLVPFGAAALALVTLLALVTPSIASPVAAVEMERPVSVSPIPALQPLAPATLAPTSVPIETMQDRECWGPFVGDGTMIERGGTSRRDYTIQRTLGDARLCMRLSGDVELDASGTGIRSMGSGASAILASREPGRDLRLEITGGPQGVEHAWYVDGERRPFDTEAREWRDAMLAVLHSSGEIARIRGQVASLRGEIASVRGRRASMLGEIASIRGREASLHGEMASVRARTASLRGEIAAIRGREASMRGEISSTRGQRASLRGQIASLDGRIASLESARESAVDAETRARLDAEAEGLRSAIREVERRIEEDAADTRVAEIERRIAEYDASRRTREVEERLRAHEAEADAAIRASEARAERLDTGSLIAEVEARLAALDVDGEVARIEQQIEALDADRRTAEIEARLGAQEQRLLEALRRVR